MAGDCLAYGYCVVHVLIRSGCVLAQIWADQGGAGGQDLAGKLLLGAERQAERSLPLQHHGA